MNLLTAYWKAHVAAVLAALAVIATDIDNGGFTWTDLYGVAAALLVTGAAVAVTPNKPTVTTPPPPRTADGKFAKKA